jgi:Ribophorin I
MSLSLQASKATVPGQPATVACFSVPVKPGSALLPGESVTFNTQIANTHRLKPVPAEISHGDPQRVVYEGTALVPSPYAVKSMTIKVLAARLPAADCCHPQKAAMSCFLPGSGLDGLCWQRAFRPLVGRCRISTRCACCGRQVKLFNNEVESYTKPAKKAGKTITYGPFSDVPAYSTSALRVHYVNNSPFAVARSVVRETEVSHWGNIYVEESYILVRDPLLPACPPCLSGLPQASVPDASLPREMPTAPCQLPALAVGLWVGRQARHAGQQRGCGESPCRGPPAGSAYGLGRSHPVWCVHAGQRGRKAEGDLVPPRLAD